MSLPLLQALRPHQWVKNLLVLAPLFFATTKSRGSEVNSFFDPTAWSSAAIALLVFCFAASSIYLLNDIVDREQDARHPKKRLRPIASGRLPVGAARIELAVVLAACVGLSFQVPPSPGGVPYVAWPAAYLVLNILYSFWLKRLVVIDCMCIAIGFQLRVQAGAAAIGVESSRWLLLCTFFFSLFLAFCKRYEEVGRQAETDGPTRQTMEDYTQSFLNVMIGPLAALSILSYSLYTVSPETIAVHHTDRLMYTVPFVVYGVFRYLFLVYRKSEGGDPARLLFRDLPLVLSGLAYGLTVVALLRWL
ncbi:MAG: decaprenyl-phosphate phosphoribosyltransferase [Planctomycetes bacterium]|nr:decaprenyl-phosphate phosphoribosyltransferase [Planctomycetota bacterium]